MIIVHQSLKKWPYLCVNESVSFNAPLALYAQPLFIYIYIYIYINIYKSKIAHLIPLAIFQDSVVFCPWGLAFSLVSAEDKYQIISKARAGRVEWAEEVCRLLSVVGFFEYVYFNRAYFNLILCYFVCSSCVIRLWIQIIQKVM